MATACGCESAGLESRTLWTVLAINAVMFLVEAVAGWWGESTGLLADSMDMFADAAVYGTALYAVGRSGELKARIAGGTGAVQLALGVGIMLELGRRLLYGSEPVGTLMIGISVVALAANVVCLVLIARHRGDGVHMRASYICSRSDVIANLGVLVSGILILFLGSRIPDLVIGTLISFVVIRGGVEILQEAKKARGREACA